MARPSKPILHRKSVIAEALQMIDENGLEAFSMPGLARRLGVKTASLYYHFTDKSAVLAGVARAVIREVRPLEFSQDDHWALWMVEMAVNYRRAVMAHPHAAPVLVSHPPRQLIASIYEGGAAVLRDAGIPESLILLLLDGVESLATASALLGTASLQAGGMGFGDLDSEQHPTLASVLAARDLDPEEFLREQARGLISGVLTRAGLDTAELFRAP